MIRLLLLLMLLPLFGIGQSVLPLRADTVRIEKVGSNGELQVKNATRTTRGPLSNVGNGVTRFIQTIRSGDTLFIAGDTIMNARKVDTIYRKPGKDSLYFTINGVERRVLDSTGGAPFVLYNALGGTGDTLVNADKEVKWLNPGAGITHTITGTTITQRVTIPSTRMPYGDGSNIIASEADLTYNATTNTLNADTARLKTGRIDSVYNTKQIIGGSKPTVGVFTEDFFVNRTTISNLYSTSLPNGSVTLDGSKMILSGGVGNSNNYLTREYWLGNENWTQTIRGTVGTINSSSYGIIISAQGTTFSNHAIFYMANDGSGNFGHIQLETSLGTAIVTSAAAVTLSTGDSIVCTITRSHQTFSATWTDITSSTSCTATYTFSYSSGANSFHNAWRPRIYLYGGTQNIGYWGIAGNMLKNVPVLGIGNSIMAGHFSATVGGRYMNTVFGSDYNLFEIDAGPSDGIADATNKLTEILAISPSYIFLDLGTNDIASYTTAQFNTVYSNFIVKLLKAGIRVIVGAITPRNSVDVTPYNNILQQIAIRYGLTYVDLYTPLKGAGTGLNAIYDNGDGLHINAAGNALMATTIASAAPELLTAQYDYALQVNRNRNYFNTTTVFPDSVAFNGDANFNVDLPTEDSSTSLVNTGWVKRLNNSSTAGFIRNQFASAQTGNFWISGAGKALKYQVIDNVNNDASGGTAAAYDGTSSLRATATNDVLATFRANSTFTDNGFGGVSHYAFYAQSGDVAFANGTFYNMLDGNTSRTLTIYPHVHQANVSGSGNQFTFRNQTASDGFSGTVVRIDGTATAAAGVMLKVLGRSNAELFNVHASGGTTIGTGSPTARTLYVDGSIGANKDSITKVTATGVHEMLVQDTTTGQFHRAAISAATTIYTGDGSLSGNRTVTGAGNTLTITGTQSSSAAFNVNNTGNGSAGAFSTTGTGSALSGTNSSSGNGLFGSSSSGNGLSATSVTGLAGRFKITPSSTNTIVSVLDVIAGSSGTPAAGRGAAVNLKITDDAGNDVSAATIQSVFTSAATGSTTGDFEVKTINSGSSAVKLRVKGSGQLELPVGYGDGTHTGTAAYTLQVDASGKVIAGSAVTSGTYTPTLTNTTNVAASTAYQFQWSRVGNTITFSGEVDIDPTAGLTLTVLTMTLPVVGSFANSFECAGTASDDLGTVARVRATATAGTAEVRMTPTDASNRRFSVHGTYLYITP